ncbi:hypothetical protein ACFQY7_54660 [Actinomadura luteofluorescens]|uniref:hypothetical protein n=1 Tax=Actinomadura luteofluorescens TaxID=46163 RepID=UPI00363AACF9
MVPVLPWVASCAAQAAPREDVPTLVGAIAAEQNLIAVYEAARSADTSRAGRLDPVLAHHRRHLAVLKRHYVPGSGDRADEGGAIPSPAAAQVPAGSAGLAALRDMEDRAARGAWPTPPRPVRRSRSCWPASAPARPGTP